MGENDFDKHLAREWDQAWNHYRHLESRRSQYLGFFFTVVLATATVAITSLKDVEESHKPIVFFGLMAMGFVVFVVTISLFAAVKKDGYVLGRYDTIKQSIRKRCGLKSSKEFPFVLDDLKMSDDTDCPEYVKYYQFSVQRTAELLLGGGSILLLVILIVAAGLSFKSQLPFTCWQKTLAVVLVVCSVAYALNVFIPIVCVRCCQKRQKKEPAGHPRIEHEGLLTDCPDCGGHVSRLAVNCPHCGRPHQPET